MIISIYPDGLKVKVVDYVDNYQKVEDVERQARNLEIRKREEGDDYIITLNGEKRLLYLFLYNLAFDYDIELR